MNIKLVISLFLFSIVISANAQIDWDFLQKANETTTGLSMDEGSVELAAGGISSDHIGNDYNGSFTLSSESIDGSSDFYFGIQESPEQFDPAELKYAFYFSQESLSIQGNGELLEEIELNEELEDLIFTIENEELVLFVNGAPLFVAEISPDIPFLATVYSTGGVLEIGMNMERVLKEVPEPEPEPTIFQQTSPDNLRNYIHSTTYADGSVISDGRIYYDKLGREVQSQIKNLETDHIIATENHYDNFGRAHIQSLPFSTYSSTFAYKNGLMTFDDNTVLTPSVQNLDQGTLGWYYSENNNADGYVPSSAYPYQQQTYYNDASGGSIKQAGGPGVNYRLGSGHETTVTKSEIVDRSQLPSLVLPDFEKKFIKTVSIDPDGNEVTVFQGKRTTITKSGTGNFCDPGVEVSFKFYDHRGRLTKHVPPEAYDCSFNAVEIINDTYAQLNVSAMTTGSNAIITETLSTYDQTLRDRTFEVEFATLDYDLPWKASASAGTGWQAGSTDCWDANGNRIYPCPPANNTGNCDPVTIATIHGNQISQVFCPEQIEFLTTGTDLNNVVATTPLPPATYTMQDDGEEPLIIQYGEWGYRFTIKLQGTEPGGNTVILAEKDYQFYVENTIDHGHRLTWDKMPGFKLRLTSQDDNGNPFQTDEGDLTAIGNIDDYTELSVVVYDFEEAQNFSKNDVFESHSFTPALSSSYAVQFLNHIALKYSFTEKPELNQPFVYENTFQYIYNVNDQVEESYTPDAGIVQYIYDDRQQVRFTQNAEQELTGSFSYIHYDHLGRPIETGLYTPSQVPGQPRVIFAMSDEIDYSALNPGEQYAIDVAMDDDGLDDSRCFEKSFFEYDHLIGTLPSGLNASLYTQDLTGGKLVKSWNGERTTWYGYDAKGRMSWLVQDINNLGIKTCHYDYYADNNLKELIYQREVSAERLHHHFIYNANSKLQQVYTTTDGTQDYTERVAYEYYDHGPLKRQVIGKNIQGLDYLYTINGKLKFINDPNLVNFDPGADGVAGSMHQDIGEDLFGMALSYHDNDYLRNDRDFYKEASVPGKYNGLVASQAWQTDVDAMDHGDEIMSYRYQYDASGQLTNATAGLAQTPVNNYYDFNALADYQVSISYDRNGNIETLQRKGSTAGGLDMDDLSYNYTDQNGRRLHNQLQSVNDAVANSAYTDDFENHTLAVNYTYNNIGRMIRDSKGKRDYSYTNSGLIKDVRNTLNSNLTFSYTYNESGQKQSQLKYDASGNASSRTHYVYDAGGLLMATYEEDISTSANPVLSQMPLYGGGSRLGKWDKTNNSSLYEIKDHLGGVRVVLMDKNNNGLYNERYNFNDVQEQTPFIESGGYGTINMQNSRLEVTGVTTTQGSGGIYADFNLEPFTSYTLSFDYQEIADMNGGLNLRMVEISTGITIQSLTPVNGINSLEFTTNSTGSYRMRLYFDSQHSPNSSYWIDNFGLREKAEVMSATDYYPFGEVLPGRNYVSAYGAYKHGYQGEYAEQDENGYTNFQLRQFDTRLGRWFVPDPMGQYVSAYLGMGNSPVNMTDPTGGFSYYNHQCDCMWDTDFGNWNDGQRMSMTGRFQYRQDMVQRSRNAIWDAFAAQGAYINPHFKEIYSVTATTATTYGVHPIENTAIIIDENGTSYNKKAYNSYDDYGNIANDIVTITTSYFIENVFPDETENLPVSEKHSTQNNPLEYVALGNDLSYGSALSYDKGISNEIKRKYAYQLSKKINTKSGKIFQTAKSYSKGSIKLLGKSAGVLTVGSIIYDFGSGQANTSTLIDATLFAGGIIAGALAGTAALPVLAAVGIGYGVATIFGFDDYIDSKIDISSSINFIKKE